MRGSEFGFQEPARENTPALLRCCNLGLEKEGKMETMDALLKCLTDLLIENRCMRNLLKNSVPDLDEILGDAKADQQRRRAIEEQYIAH